MKRGCLCESYFYVCVWFGFFKAILGVTFSGILRVLYSATVIAHLAGSGFSFNTVATNSEMLLPGKVIKGTALKKGCSEGDVKMMVIFVTCYSTRSYPPTVLKLTLCNSNFFWSVPPQWFWLANSITCKNIPLQHW